MVLYNRNNGSVKIFKILQFSGSHSTSNSNSNSTPQNSQNINLGQIFNERNQQKLKEARDLCLKKFERSVHYNINRFGDLHFAIAECSLKTGNLADAIMHYKVYIAMGGKRYQGLARAHLRLGVYA